MQQNSSTGRMMGRTTCPSLEVTAIDTHNVRTAAAENAQLLSCACGHLRFTLPLLLPSPHTAPSPTCLYCPAGNRRHNRHIGTLQGAVHALLPAQVGLPVDIPTSTHPVT